MRTKYALCACHRIWRDSSLRPHSPILIPNTPFCLVGCIRRRYIHCIDEWINDLPLKKSMIASADLPCWFHRSTAHGFNSCTFLFFCEPSPFLANWFTKTHDTYRHSDAPRHLLPFCTWVYLISQKIVILKREHVNIFFFLAFVPQYYRTWLLLRSGLSHVIPYTFPPPPLIFIHICGSGMHPAAYAGGCFDLWCDWAAQNRQKTFKIAATSGHRWVLRLSLLGLPRARQVTSRGKGTVSPAGP